MSTPVTGTMRWRRDLTLHPGDGAWRIAALFTIVNSGTFAGAACFFAGAYLLLPPANGTPHS